MQGTGISNPTLDGMARDRATATRRVIDAPTRMFHWLFALSFVGAYASGDTSSGARCTSRSATRWPACSAFALCTGFSGRATRG